MSSIRSNNTAHRNSSPDLDALREEPIPEFNWSEEAANTSDATVSTGVPFRVALVEALLLVLFVRTYWDAHVDGYISRPGLSSARLPEDLWQQILSLFRRVRDEDEAFLLASAPRESVNLLRRGDDVLDELKAAIEHYADDGEETELDVQVESLKREHGGADSYSELAQALDDYAAVAQPIRHELDGLGDFSAATIDEARDLALQLRVAPHHRGPLTPEQKQALSRRNRYLRMLWNRVTMVRRAAQFVFRHHPEIARLATSAYRRQKAAEARRRKLQKEQKSA